MGDDGEDKHQSPGMLIIDRFIVRKNLIGKCVSVYSKLNHLKKRIS